MRRNVRHVGVEQLALNQLETAVSLIILSVFKR